MSKSVSKLLVSLAIVFSLISCKDGKRAQEIIEDVKVNKADVEGVYGKHPYAESEQLVFSEYFRGIAKLAMILDENKDKLLTVEVTNNYDWDEEDDFYNSGEATRKASQKFDVTKLCDELLIDTAIWQEIRENCYVGEYFVCSEEVRGFDSVLSSIYSNLDNKNKTKFKGNRNCGNWMLLLKLDNN